MALGRDEAQPTVVERVTEMVVRDLEILSKEELIRHNALRMATELCRPLTLTVRDDEDCAKVARAMALVAEGLETYILTGTVPEVEPERVSL